MLKYLMIQNYFQKQIYLQNLSNLFPTKSKTNENLLEFRQNLIYPNITELIQNNGYTRCKKEQGMLILSCLWREISSLNLGKNWRRSPMREYFVGNKAKGRILKRVFQENKARQIFWKTNISYPTYVCVSGVKKCTFSRKLGVLCFLETTVLRFFLLPYYRRYFCYETQT